MRRPNTAQQPVIGCSQEECTTTVQNHYWARVKAEDWFFQRSGEAWCPAHVPDWVAGWREGKKTQQA